MTAKDSPRRLDYPLASLGLSVRASRALEAAGLATVADFVDTPRDRVMAVRGCGPHTYQEIERLVLGFLSRCLLEDDPKRDLQRPAAALVEDEAARERLRENGIDTVSDMLHLGPSAGPRKLGKPLWQQLQAHVVQTRQTRQHRHPLWPDSLLELPLAALALPGTTRQDFEELGCTTVGHAVSLPPAALLGEGFVRQGAVQDFRRCLDQLVRAAWPSPDQANLHQAADWPTLRGQMVAPLEPADQDWFTARVGFPGAAPATGASAARDGSDRQAEARDAAVRQAFLDRAPSLHLGIRREVMAELEAFEGLLQSDRLAAGSMLHALAKGSSDPGLPLRIAAFLWPEEFCYHDGVLCTLSARDQGRILQRLRVLCAPRHLPRRLADLPQELAGVTESLPHGVLLHLLTTQLHLRIHIDHAKGELVMPAQTAPSARLAELLEEEGRPTQLVDLMFHYRERYRAARKLRLQSVLRNDQTFLEIGPDLWSLRRWHEDELARTTPLVENAVTRLLEVGGRHAVRELLPDSPARTHHLVLDAMRRHPSVRYLGRGDVCPASHRRSSALAQLLTDFRRAMGEVPMSRFVANQPAERRRLVRRLLEENRLFVFPSEDRIDVLTNYPFNEERLGRLLNLVDQFLTTHSGYAPLQAVLDEVNRCDLGGSWLHPILLGELLRRHGHFEILPGEFIARRSLGLGGWLMRRARAALREVGLMISIAELLVERPELAEFKDCLEDLLQRDPLVESPDGTRFQIS